MGRPRGSKNKPVEPFVDADDDDDDALLTANADLSDDDDDVCPNYSSLDETVTDDDMQAIKDLSDDGADLESLAQDLSVGKPKLAKGETVVETLSTGPSVSDTLQKVLVSVTYSAEAVKKIRDNDPAPALGELQRGVDNILQCLTSLTVIIERVDNTVGELPRLLAKLPTPSAPSAPSGKPPAQAARDEEDDKNKDQWMRETLRTKLRKQANGSKFNFADLLSAVYRKWFEGEDSSRVERALRSISDVLRVTGDVAVITGGVEAWDEH